MIPPGCQPYRGGRINLVVTIPLSPSSQTQEETGAPLAWATTPYPSSINFRPSAMCTSPIVAPLPYVPRQLSTTWAQCSLQLLGWPCPRANHHLWVPQHQLPVVGGCSLFCSCPIISGRPIIGSPLLEGVPSSMGAHSFRCTSLAVGTPTSVGTSSSPGAHFSRGTSSSAGAPSFLGQLISSMKNWSCTQA